MRESLGNLIERYTMNNYNNIDENELLRIAHSLDEQGDIWLETIKKDKNYFLNNAPVFHIIDGAQCNKHSSMPLKRIRRSIMAFSKKQNLVHAYEVKAYGCKYCKKFFIEKRHFDSLIASTYPFARFAYNGILISNLTEESLENENRTDLKRGASGLYSICQNDLKYIPSIQKKKALIPICKFDGTIIKEPMIVYYSWYTGQYYAYSASIKQLKEKGIILCRLLSAQNSCLEQAEFGKLNIESLIHQFGYNVSKQANLSDMQRHQILRFVLNNGICSYEDIKNHLSFLINLNKTSYKMNDAIHKWINDFDYLESVEITDLDVVEPISIIEKLQIELD